MASNTFIKIASTTVGSGGASSITFSSIPNTYTDLKILFSLQSTTANQNTDGLFFKINSSTSNFTRVGVYGGGDALNGTSGSNAYVGMTSGASATSTFGNGEIYIANYLNNDNKAIYSDVASEANQLEAYLMSMEILWSQTSAITQIDLYYSGGDSFAQYSTATLYGIKNS